MDGFAEGDKQSKKVARATTREYNTGLYMLRVKQLGLSFSELEDITVGDVTDMIIEQANDECEYPIKATQADFDKFRGS